MTYSLFLFAAILAVGCDAYDGTKQKYQVLMPQPQSHSSGVSTLWLGAAEISSISEAAEAAGKETISIVASQFLARMPDVEDMAPARKSTLQVSFLHKLPEWQGASSWQPIRQRNESYGLAISDNSLVIDAQSSWHWQMPWRHCIS